MNAVVLPDDARDRLAKLLGMLGSDHAGERAAAGLQAHRLVQQHKLTWPDVLAPPALPPPGTTRSCRSWVEPVGPQEMAATCLRWAEILTVWETEFLKTVGGMSPRQLSQKQIAVLEWIVAKCRAYARTEAPA